MSSFVCKSYDKYKVSWKATNSVLANELLLREILKTTSYIKGRVLDIGCGEKPYRDIFSSRIDSYIGVDLPQTVHAKHAIDIFANAHYLPFKKDTFDTVLCLEILEHVEMPLEVLKEIHRILKPGWCAYFICTRKTIGYIKTRWIFSVYPRGINRGS